jgi:uncharacterized membrane protein
MDDEVGHRFKEDHTVRNVFCTATATILLIAIFGYLDLSEKTIYALIGAVAGCSIRFLIGYTVGNKR